MSSDDKVTDTPDEMRPLPDGGLQSTMPDWLRRPPAWRDLPRGEGAGEDKTLPEPDTSMIDPRSLVDVADLPPWLQGIGSRSAQPVESSDASHIAVEREESSMHTQDDQNQDTTQPEERTVPFQPVDKRKWDIPEEKTETYGGPKKTGLSQQMLMAIGLVVLVIILIILFAVIL